MGQAHVIGLISWAAGEGSTVSSLICDRWLTHKIATFMGLTDSLECSFSCHDQHSVTAMGLDPYSEPAKRGWSLALAAWGLDFWRTSEWGADGVASLDLQRTYKEGAGPSPC